MKVFLVILGFIIVLGSGLYLWMSFNTEPRTVQTSEILDSLSLEKVEQTSELIFKIVERLVSLSTAIAGSILVWKSLSVKKRKN